MPLSSRLKLTLSVLIAIVLLGAVALAVSWGPRLRTWRHLDRTYAEEFPSPAELASTLANKRVLFHIKTGLAQDDSQICVGFNIVFAALEAGADVAVLFDAGALLDLIGENSNLAATGVPLRLQKVIAAQMHLSLEEMPSDYRAYLELLHRRGAAIYANTAMLIVTGDADKVQQKLPGFPFVEPAPYAQVAQLITEADTVLVY